MKGENDEGERSIDEVMEWAEHLYHLPTGYTGCPRKICTVRISSLKLFLLQFLRKKIFYSKVW